MALDFRLVLYPRVDAPGDADVIVVLAGEEESRLPTALRLFGKGVAADLLVSFVPGDPASSHTAQLCADPPPRVSCRGPREISTRGEARMVADLADQQHWRRVFIVTSAMHVTRARTLFERCFPGEVRVIASANPDSGRERVRLFVHESGGLLHALLRRGC